MILSLKIMNEIEGIDLVNGFLDLQLMRFNKFKLRY